MTVGVHAGPRKLGCIEGRQTETCQQLECGIAKKEWFNLGQTASRLSPAGSGCLRLAHGALRGPVLRSSLGAGPGAVPALARALGCKGAWGVEVRGRGKGVELVVGQAGLGGC